MAVFVLAKQKNPLMPCSERRARKLPDPKLARIHRMYPFPIRLVDRTGGDTQPRTLKIDPGSKQTGMALVRQTEDKTHLVALLEVKYRSPAISNGSCLARYRSPAFMPRSLAQIG
jgi:hypothetical protein